MTNIPLRSVSCRFALVFGILLGFGAVAKAQTVNIAPDGTAILGLSQSSNYDGSTDFAYFDPEGGGFPASNMTDGNPSTLGATFYEAGHGPFPVPYDSSYAGVLGGGFATDTETKSVQSIQVVFSLFTDGGWFGPNGTDPGADTPLAAADLIAPTVQITTNGTTWTSVGATSDYVTQLTGALHDNELNSNVATFTLDTPQSDIEGIRLIGLNGGTAGTGNGFLAVSDFEVLAEIPEPSAYALMGVGIAALALMSRFRKLTRQA